MEILVPFLNRNDLSQHISTSMSNILTYQNDSTKQIKEMQELSRVLDILPNNLQLDSIPIACQLFDYLLQNSPTSYHYRLLSSCLNFMKIDDRLQHIKNILLTILDNEQTTQLRELLCKLLNTIDISTTASLDFNWVQLESAMYDQHDPKFLTYISRFLSKYHQTNFEEILLRTLPIIDNNDELFLLLLIDLQSIKIFVTLPSFWYLIQRSLADKTSNNDRKRKCALYLLKQILTNDECKHIEIKEEKFDRLLILIDDKTQQFWMDFIILYEALEDGVVHLIKPLLIKFDRILNFSLEQSIFFLYIFQIKFFLFLFKELSLTYLFILLQRLFENASSPLGRWTVRWFLNSMKLPDHQIENVNKET